MKKKRRIANLTRLVLDRNPDLVLVNEDTLWVRPIRHVGRQIHFYHPRKDYFTLQWHLSALFVPALWVAPHIGSFYDKIGRSSLQPSHGDHRLWCDSPGLQLYRDIYPLFDEGCGLWSYDDPAMADDLIFQIETVLRLLRSLDTLEKCIAFLRPRSVHSLCQIEHWTMMMDLAVGAFGAAHEHWLGVRHRHRRQSLEEPQGYFERIAHRWGDLDEPLMSMDRQALAALMTRWETENVRMLDMEDIWDPWPFPFETPRMDSSKATFE